MLNKDLQQKLGNNFQQIASYRHIWKFIITTNKLIIYKYLWESCNRCFITNIFVLFSVGNYIRFVFYIKRVQKLKISLSPRTIRKDININSCRIVFWTTNYNVLLISEVPPMKTSKDLITIVPERSCRQNTLQFSSDTLILRWDLDDLT